MPTTWDEHGNIITAPPQKQSWDEHGNPVGPEKAGFGKRFLKASGFEGLVESKEPQTFGEAVSQGLAPAKELAKKAAAPMQHLGEIIAAHKAGNKEGVMSAVSKFIDSFIPGTGNAEELTSQTIKDVQEGNVPAVLGTAAGLGTQLALTRSALKEPVAGPGPTAQKLYQSALKPPPGSYSTSEVTSMVKTGLKYEIPVSAGGIDKLHGLVADLNKAVQAEIDAGAAAGKTVDKYAVTSRLAGTSKKFATQVNPEADLKAVGESGNEFLRNQPTKIPASEAQAIKSGTYKQLGDKAYGELSSATKEAQKSLARGIKEELETQFPEIKGMNAQESKLFELQPALERAVRRIDNHDIISLGSKVAAGTGAVIGGAPGAVAGGILERALGMPMVKSRLAIALASKGKMSLSTAAARIAEFTSRLASANAQNEEDPAP